MAALTRRTPLEWSTPEGHTMRIIVILAVLCVGALAEGDPAAQPDSLERCFKEDSISCVQRQVFRGMKAFFDQEKIELFGGVSLVKEPAAAASPAEGRAADEDADAARMLDGEGGDAARREDALEEYALRKVGGFLEERAIKLDLSSVVKSVAERARALVAAIPPEVRQKVVDFAAEGRGKKKKLQRILPILILGGLKAAGLVGLTFLGIALLAKKAILVSIVSIAISAFIGLKKLLSQQHHHGYHHEVHEAIPVHGHGWSGGSYGSAGGSFDVSGYSGGHEYAAHSSPVGHAVAYSAHKPGARRR